MADKVKTEESLARVYQFLNTQTDWKSSADKNGDGVIGKTEFRTYLLGSNFVWKPGEATDKDKEDLISAFWKTIDFNTKGSIGGGSKINNKNALDYEELANVGNNLIASDMIKKFMANDSHSAPASLQKADYRKRWKESVIGGMINQAAQLLKNLKADLTDEERKAEVEKILTQEKLEEIFNNSAAKATADYVAREQIENMPKGDDGTSDYTGYTPGDDTTLQGLVNEYIAVNLGNDVENKPDQKTVEQDIIALVQAYINTANPNGLSQAQKEMLIKYGLDLSEMNPIQEQALKNTLTKAIKENVVKLEYYSAFETEINSKIADFAKNAVSGGEYGITFQEIMKNKDQIVADFSNLEEIKNLKDEYDKLVTDRNKFYLEVVAVEWYKQDHNEERQQAIKDFFEKESIDDIQKAIQSYSRTDLDGKIAAFDQAIKDFEAGIVAKEEAEKAAAEAKYKEHFGNLAGLIDDIMTDKLSSMINGYAQIHTEFGIDSSSNKIVFQDTKADEVYKKVQKTVKQQFELKDKEAYEAIGNDNLTNLIQAAWIMAYNTYPSSQSNPTAGFVGTVLANLENMLNSLKENPDLIDVYSSHAYANAKLTFGLIHYGATTTYGNDEIIKYEDNATIDANGVVHIVNTTDDPDYQNTMTVLLSKILKTEPYSKLDKEVVTNVFRKAQEEAIKTMNCDKNDCPYGTGNNGQRVTDTTRDWSGEDNRSGDGCCATMQQLVDLTLYYFDKLLFNELAQ